MKRISFKKSILILSTLLIAFLVFHYSRKANLNDSVDHPSFKTQLDKEDSSFDISQECELYGDHDLFGPSDCTPEPDKEDFKGLLIYASEEDSVKEFLEEDPIMIPYIFGTLIFDPKDGEYPIEQLEIVVREVQSDKTFTKKMGDLDRVDEKPGLDFSTDQEEGYEYDLRGELHQFYFNPNLLDIIDVPQPGATYEVYAQLKDFKSNILRVTFTK